MSDAWIAMVAILVLVGVLAVAVNRMGPHPRATKRGRRR
jgi:uncharacterized protein (DUF3084 family)